MESRAAAQEAQPPAERQNTQKLTARKHFDSCESAEQKTGLTPRGSFSHGYCFQPTFSVFMEPVDIIIQIKFFFFFLRAVTVKMAINPLQLSCNLSLTGYNDYR